MCASNDTFHRIYPGCSFKYGILPTTLGFKLRPLGIVNRLL
ncbi:unnamed protein product, partial [Vitis vinifera]